MSPTVTILLAEDNPILSRALRALLRTEPRFRLVGHTVDGEAAVGLAAEFRPDVVVMDVNLPGAFDGVEATRRIKAGASPESRVIGMSASSDRDDDMLRAGAVRFLRKDRATQLIGVIKTVMGG